MFKKIKSLVETNKNKKNYILAIAVVLVGGGLYLFQNSKTDQKTNVPQAFAKEYKTITPKKLQDEKKILIGKVLSHESARVFPRRSGVVEDILVDIGDRVTKGQVLAYLLPEGVENESGLEIQVQRNMMLRAADDYKNTKIVSGERIKNLEEKLNQEMVKLDRLKEDKYQEMSDSGDNELRLKSEQLQLANSQLQLLNVELQELKDLESVNYTDVENGILHAKNNYKAAFEYVLQTELNVLAGGEAFHGSPYGLGVSLGDLDESLGFFDQQARADSVNLVNQLINKLSNLVENGESNESDYAELQYLAESSLIAVQQLIRASGPGTGFDLHSLSDQIVMAQDKLVKAQEKYENALDAFNMVATKDSKAISIQREKITQQEAQIALLESQWSQTGTEVESKIKIMEAGISKLKQEIEYEKSLVQKSVDSSRNQYNIANSSYLKTAAKKGNTQITAPFSGVISKRSIDVGELAMTSMAAFDLVEVETTLSKKAKNEIQFGVPEDLQGVVEIGDVIRFYLPEDDLTVYEAEVTRKSPQVDEELHTITVQAKLPDDLRFPHHTSVQVELITGEKDTYQVDSSVLKREDEKNYFWVLNGEDVEKLFVTVIEEDGEFAEIAGDLEGETQVVTNYYGRK